MGTGRAVLLQLAETTRRPSRSYYLARSSALSSGSDRAVAPPTRAGWFDALAPGRPRSGCRPPSSTRGPPVRTGSASTGDRRRRQRSSGSPTGGGAWRATRTAARAGSSARSSTSPTGATNVTTSLGELDTLRAVESQRAGRRCGPRSRQTRDGLSRATPICRRACYELVGYTAEELLAEPEHFERLVHPDDVELVAMHSAEANETGVWDDIYRVIHRDGVGPMVPRASAAAHPTRCRAPRCGTGVDDRRDAQVEAARAADAGPAPPVCATPPSRLPVGCQHPHALGQVLPQVLGDLDAAVGALVVLQDRDQRAPDRGGRAVQRVQRLERAVGAAHARLQPPRLVVGRVRAARQLAVALLAGQPSPRCRTSWPRARRGRRPRC